MQGRGIINKQCYCLFHTFSIGPIIQQAKPQLPIVSLPKFKDDVKHWTAFLGFASVSSAP